MYFATMSPDTGRLNRLEMVPLQMKRFQLHRASRKDTRWLREMLAREGRQLGTTITLAEDNTLEVC
jgi:poly-gamma-glutamate capsule biosynthesis protein CapA/YwtB (metallophosphatase superfamily)